MSRIDSARPGLGDDARFDLAMAAAGRARRNRPTALVIAAAAALLAALVGAAWGIAARASARAALVRELNDQAEVQRLSADWTRLDRQEKEAGEANVGAPIRDMRTRLEGMAHNAGMKDVKQPRLQQSQRPGITVNEWQYQDVRDPSLKSLLDWMRQATTEIPGLEVAAVTLRPDPNGWTLNVTFRRWERAG